MTVARVRIGREPACSVSRLFSERCFRLAGAAGILALAVGCAGQRSLHLDCANHKSARYPAHWWAPVAPAADRPWEILPQEAGPGEVIVSKRHELGLLSNFAHTPFAFRGVTYQSIEGFWQMMKYPESPDDVRAMHPGITWRHTRAEVAQMTGFAAKAAGDLASANMRTMGIDWVTFEGQRLTYRAGGRGLHFDLIVSATREKIRQNPRVRAVLLATGDLVLRPDHDQGADPPPAWRYCEILMRIRDDLRTGSAHCEARPAESADALSETAGRRDAPR